MFHIIVYLKVLVFSCILSRKTKAIYEYISTLEEYILNYTLKRFHKISQN